MPQPELKGKVEVHKTNGRGERGRQEKAEKSRFTSINRDLQERMAQAWEELEAETRIN